MAGRASLPTPTQGPRPPGTEDRSLHHCLLPPGLVVFFCLPPPSSAPIRCATWSRPSACGPCASSSRRLTVTPLRQLLSINLLRYRRAIGLLAFYYAALHLTTYLVLDQGLDLAAIVGRHRQAALHHHRHGDLRHPRAPGRDLQQCRDPAHGGQAWAKLHRLVYVAAIGAVLGFILVVKSWPPEPLVYAAIVAVLLGYRLVRRTTNGRAAPPTHTPPNLGRNVRRVDDPPVSARLLPWAAWACQGYGLGAPISAPVVPRSPALARCLFLACCSRGSLSSGAGLPGVAASLKNALDEAIAA